jgi:uncharacterized FlaG/YvyC family protein
MLKQEWRDPMSDYISSIQRVPAGQSAKPVEQGMPETGRPAPAAEPKVAETKTAEVKAAESQAAKAKEAAASEEARAALPIKEMSNVHLKYSVNPDTKELTVLVIDRASHKVIRTIPSEELSKLKQGDLFQLSS